MPWRKAFLELDGLYPAYPFPDALSDLELGSIKDHCEDETLPYPVLAEICRN